MGGEQSYPQVAGLSDGGFVVTWQDSNGNEGSGWGWGVFGQRFGADGSPVGGQITINTTTSGTQYHSTLASYTDGYAVVWSSEGYMSGSDSYDIYLTRFDNAGNVVGTPEQRVSTAVGSSAAQPGYQEARGSPPTATATCWWSGRTTTATTAAAGRLRSRVSRRHRQLRRHLPGQQLHPSTQISPDVAALSDGGYVVWRDDNGRDGSGYATYAQRYDASGAAVGGEIQVNENTYGSQYQARVSGLSTGGFVVAFKRQQRLGATCICVNSTPAATRWMATGWSTATPLITTSPNRRWRTWATATSWSPGARTRTRMALARASSSNCSAARPRANVSPPLTCRTSGSVTFEENAVNAGLQVIDAAVSLTDSDSANFNGGRLDPVFHQRRRPARPAGRGGRRPDRGMGHGEHGGGHRHAERRSQWQQPADRLHQHRGDAGSGEALIQHLGYGNTGFEPVGEPDAGPAGVGWRRRQQRTQPADGECHAATGRYACGVWRGSRSIPSRIAIRMRRPSRPLPTAAMWSPGSPSPRTAADGVSTPSASMRPVRRSAPSSASVPSCLRARESYPVAAGLSDGGYVVVWQDSSNKEGGGWGRGVFSQRFNADGSAAGGTTVVNTTTSGYQYHGAVAALHRRLCGGVVGDSYYVSGYYYQDIYLTRFDNAGNVVGTPESG